MGSPAKTPRSRPAWVTERRWDAAARPLPRQWVLPDSRMLRSKVAALKSEPGRAGNPLDFCAAMRAFCGDVIARCPELSHIDPRAVLVTFTPSRTRSRYGLQARVTPMRFRGGATTRLLRGVPYQVQRYVVDGREVLYLVTFCLPRFLDQSFAEKLITVFHELYHISPAFDGDLRRHPGRYSAHSHSKKDYDRRMAALVTDYLAGHPDPGVYAFLRPGYVELWRAHGGITGVVVPRPKLVPVRSS